MALTGSSPVDLHGGVIDGLSRQRRRATGDARHGDAGHHLTRGGAGVVEHSEAILVAGESEETARSFGEEEV